MMAQAAAVTGLDGFALYIALPVIAALAFVYGLIRLAEPDTDDSGISQFRREVTGYDAEEALSGDWGGSDDG